MLDFLRRVLIDPLASQVPSSESIKISDIESRVSALAFGVLEAVNTEEAPKIARELLDLAKSHVTNLSANASVVVEQAMQVLEQKAGEFKLSWFDKRNCHSFQTQIHSRLEGYHKWVDSGFPAAAYLHDPELAQAIFSLHLHNNIRYYGHTVQFDEARKKVLIMVDGTYTDASSIIKNLEEREAELVSKADPEEHWAYLPTGLSCRSLSKWERLEPCAQLSAEQLAYVQACAKSLPSEGARHYPERANCVVEIVSSWIQTETSIWTDGFKETFDMPKHPWVRLITPDGRVRIVGFGWKKPPAPDQVATTVHGVFRSPDPWEAMHHLARPITRIAATQTELNDILQSIEKHQRDGTAFNLVQHNCTRFIQHVLEKLGMSIEVEATASEMFLRLCPIWLQKLYRKVDRVTMPVRKIVKIAYDECMPPIVRRVAEFAAKKLSCLYNVVAVMLGGLKGPVARQFPAAGAPALPSRRTALIRSVKDFFNERLVRPILPRKLIEWQMRQPSTTVYPESVGFYGQYEGVLKQFQGQDVELSAQERAEIRAERDSQS